MVSTTVRMMARDGRFLQLTVAIHNFFTGNSVLPLFIDTYEKKSFSLVHDYFFVLYACGKEVSNHHELRSVVPCH